MDLGLASALLDGMIFVRLLCVMVRVLYPYVAHSGARKWKHLAGSVPHLAKAPNAP